MNSTEETTGERPWVELAEVLREKDGNAASALLSRMSGEEQRFAMAHLSSEQQSDLTTLLTPDEAAHLLEHLPDVQAADILEDMTPAEAADVVEELEDELRAEVIREMGGSESEAILAELDDQTEAEEIRDICSHEWDTATALMNRSYAFFNDELTVDEVLSKLGEDAEEYSDLDVQYVYIVDRKHILRGVLRLRDLVLTPRHQKIADIMIREPLSASAEASFDELCALFEGKSYVGLPVTTADGRLVGVVTSKALREATAEHQTEDYLHSAGILGGEELRSMPILSRCGRRLAWLGPNILLNLIAASVIASHEETLAAVIALAVFLPMVSDMSGCSGNQAVAVSIRELTLGLLRPTEFLRIFFKEGIRGIINGMVVGIVLAIVAAVWKDNLWLGLVVGSALACNTVLSVLLGGMVPLLLKRLGVDPALASGPILTTCTDMCGFFLGLGLASQVLERLV